MHIAYAHHLGRVAIGNKAKRQFFLFGQAFGRAFGPVVIVLHRHYQVAACQCFFAVEDAGSDTVVIHIGSFVRAGNHNHTVRTVVAVIAHQALNQFVARQNSHFAMRAGTDGRNAIILLGQKLTDAGSSCQHIAFVTLAHHFGQVGTAHQHTVAFKGCIAQGGAFGFAHGGKLCRIAHKEQAATGRHIHIAHQVVEQFAGAEHRRFSCCACGYHRGLVHNEKSIAKFVVAQVKAGSFAAECFLPVNHAVNGVGAFAGHACKHLGSASGGCQQHHGFLPLSHHAHQGADNRRLARSGITAQNAGGMGFRGGYKVRKQHDGSLLSGGRNKP